MPASQPLVLVTGGAGYIGSVLVPALLANNFAVRVVDTLYYSNDSLDAVRDRIELIHDDMRSLGPHHLKGVHAIVNLGGLSTEPAAEYQPEATRAINQTAAIELARMAKAAGVRRFVQASSCSNYDVGAGKPELDILHTEDFPVKPFRIYSISKVAAEQGIFALADGNFTPVALRKGSVFGYSPRMRMDLVLNTFSAQGFRGKSIVLHNGGETWRPILGIQDAVQGYLLALSAPADRVSGQIFNIVTCNVRISELALRAQTELRQMGYECRIEPDYEFRNLRSCQASNRKAVEVLGFTPQTSVAGGVRELVGALRSGQLKDPDDLRWHNIRWLDAMEKAQRSLNLPGSVFDLAMPELQRLQTLSSPGPGRAVPA